MIGYSGFSKREITCLTGAILLHMLLFLWKAQPFKLADQMDPIVSVNFIEEQIGMMPSPEQAEGGGGAKSLFTKIKKMLGFSEKILQEVKPSDQSMAGDLSQKIQTKNPMQDFPKQPSLVNKTATLSKSFKADVANSANESLQTTGAETIQVASSKMNPAKLDPDKLLSNKEYRVAKADLPFEVAKAPTGELATGSENAGSAGPAIAVANKTDRGVRSVSDTFVEDKGSYAGSSGSGLSGTGGFTGAAPVSSKSDSSSSNTGLAGAGGGSDSGSIPIGSGGGGRRYGGGTGQSFSGAGMTEGGASGGDVGQGGLESGGGTGSKKGVSGGGGIYEIRGPLANRPILRKVIPQIPEKFKKSGLFTSVSLRFEVISTGEVKKSIEIVQTSGYPELDKQAEDALVQWKFAPLKEYGTVQWGIITFNFKVK
jgi:TonB family protein